MAAEYYTQVTLEHDSALPEDRSVNTWAVRVVDVDPVAELTLWHAALEDFYLLIDQYLSTTLSGAATIKSYRRSDPEPRVPELDTPLALTVGATALPAEVAFCLSFQAIRVAGQPQARRRGRVFLGPLYDDADANTTGRPAAGLLTGVANAAEGLLAASNAQLDWAWVVWSPTNGSSQLVDNGWCDNAFDTQRRRGLRATSRITFS